MVKISILENVVDTVPLLAHPMSKFVQYLGEQNQLAFSFMLHLIQCVTEVQNHEGCVSSVEQELARYRLARGFPRGGGWEGLHLRTPTCNFLSLPVFKVSSSGLLSACYDRSFVDSKTCSRLDSRSC